MKKLLFVNLIVLSIFAADDGTDLAKDLINACQKGDLAKVKSALEAGADANQVHEGKPALYWTSSENNIDIIELLLDNGADPNQVDDEKEIKLHHLIYYNKKLIELLFRHGADPNQANIDGDTPLHRASSNEWGDERVILALLEAGADPNQANNNGNTPLHEVIRIAPLMKNYKEIAGLLLSKGADKNKPNNDGETALTIALQHSDGEIAQLLKDTDFEAELVINSEKEDNQAIQTSHP